MDKKTLSKINNENNNSITYTSIGGDIISQKTLNGNYQILVDMVNEVKNVRETAKKEREKQINDLVEIDDVLTNGNLFL
jgi:uncharacterized protein YaaN involved in tellurite resistance